MDIQIRQTPLKMDIFLWFVQDDNHFTVYKLPIKKHYLRWTLGQVKMVSVCKRVHCITSEITHNILWIKNTRIFKGINEFKKMCIMLSTLSSTAKDTQKQQLQSYFCVIIKVFDLKNSSGNEHEKYLLFIEFKLAFLNTSQMLNYSY